MRRTLALTCAAHVGSQAAEDVVQDALLKIWQHRDRYDPERSGFSTWAVTIARNTAIDHKRALARRHQAMRSLAREVAPPGPLSEDAAIASEASRAVRGAAGALDHDQREAIFHAYWLGHSHREIASAMRIPLGTVKGRVRNGVARMRSALEQDTLVATGGAGTPGHLISAPVIQPAPAA